MIGSSTSITGISGLVARKCGPTIAAEAGDALRSLAYRSFSMNVMSPGPASPTGSSRVDRDVTVPVEPAPDQGGELFHRGDHVRLPFFPERS